MMTMARWTLLAPSLLLAIVAMNDSLCYANVVLFDGFDDADRDNDALSDDGNENPVATNDGIEWYGINGLTGDLSKQKPFLTVVDDGGGIDSGNALNIESVGANGEFIGAFDQSYQLGSAVGSRIAMSFDVRFTDLFLPSSAEFRFGMYGDTDGQFGSAGTNSDGSPTVWGGSDGNFDAESPGAMGDLGIYTRVQLGESPSLDGSGTRIVDEANANNILGGAGDSDLIAIAGDDLFGVINDGTTNSFELAAERVAPGTTGETVEVTLTMTDSDGVATTLTGLDGDTSATDVFATGDAFRYFVGSVTADADYRIDNFQLVVEEATVGLASDFNGDGMVDLLDLDILGSNFGLNPATTAQGDANGDSTVDLLDLDILGSQFGQSANAASSVPEPTGVALWLLACTAAARRRSGRR